MEIRSFEFGTTCVDYLIDDTQNVCLQIYPVSKKHLRQTPWEEPEGPQDCRARYTHGWNIGHLAYYHLTSMGIPGPGLTMQVFYLPLRLVRQELIEEEGCKCVETLVDGPGGCQILHKLTYVEGLGGLQVETELINVSGSQVTVDMLSSFALDNLSPFQWDDAPNTYNLHRFMGGWAKEGRHICQTIEELSLEKPWPGWPQCAGSERWGCRGTYPCEQYFPTGVFEDKKAGVWWGAQLATPSTWQMELCRWDDGMCFAGGLGDREFCGWKKNLENGEHFKAPTAFIAVSDEDVYDCCNRLTDMMKPAYRAYGEKGLPITFNEYCATWGLPTQEKMLNFCKVLKPYGVQYLMIDAGWCCAGQEQAGLGEWLVDTSIFPDVKAMNRTIRENGMIPGIWFEYEVTTAGSPMFEAEYDHMHLTRDGYVIKHWDRRSYWDLRRDDVQAYLQERVIDFLKENDFGYIKVDYNGNLGMDIDGAESGAEALRQHALLSVDFFKKMRQQIPGLIVENCASGGHRSEAAFMGASAVTSFSDCHEGVEIPYIAANLLSLMLPAQNLLWCVVRPDDSVERLVYSLSATFMGRVCLSGDIDKLQPWQEQVIQEGLDFYRLLEDIILNGRSKVYGTRSQCMRYPEGLQVVTMQTQSEMLILYHAFEGELTPVTVPVPDGFRIAASYHGDNIHVDNGKATVQTTQNFTAGAVLLKK